MERTSPNFRQSVRAATQRLGLRTFWRWWVGELVPLLPARLRNAFARRRLRPVVAFESDAAVVWAPRVANGGIDFAETARIPLSGDPVAVARDGQSAIAALPGTAYGGEMTETKVLVGLPASQVLRKTITLPAAVEENLRQVLTYDLDRHTPFKADEVYFDAIVVGRDSVKKEIRVDWSAALKSIVDEARRRAESWGATVVGVTPESPAGAPVPAGRALNLLPEAERPDTSIWRRWEILLPVVLIGAVALMATALPLWQKRGYAIALMQLANQGRAQADASNALREQLELFTGDYNFALQRKYAYPAAVQVVDDVTKLLPDDTWLTQLEMKTTARGKDPRREIVIRGESANAGRLVSLLEDSKIFVEAAPRSPTTKIQPGPGEIFDVGAQLKPLPPPQPIEIARVETTESPPAAAIAAPKPGGPNDASPAPAPPGTSARPATNAAPGAAAPRAAPQAPAVAPIPSTQGPAPAPEAPAQVGEQGTEGTPGAVEAVPAPAQPGLKQGAP
jgi:general secretion pathway protein L